MKVNVIFLCSLLVTPPLYATCEQAQEYYDQAIHSNTLDKAIIYYQQSAHLCKNYAVYYEQGKTLIKLNYLDKALDSFKQALKFSTKNSNSEAKALAQIARVYFEQGQLQQASFYIEEAYTIGKQRSVQWIIHLRQAIDIKNTTHIASVKEINQLLLIQKGNFSITQPTIKLNSITFESSSAELTTQGHQQVIELGKALINILKDSQQVWLIGHTDKKGENSYNMKLSKHRAKAVKQALIHSNKKLVSILKTQGKGEDQLKYFGDNEDDHRLNRRVEINIL